MNALVAGAATAMPVGAQTTATTDSKDDRAYWIEVMKRVSDPVLLAVSKEQLRATMPVESVAGVVEERRKSTHLEAFGRLLCGIAPWLEGTASGDEAVLQARYREWSLKGLAYGTDPRSRDYMNFGMTSQSVVDTAFLALAILR
ncbi:MAG TPA: DUF2264 domain-containing protein, partial [Terriglobus sp.]